ncbi:adhesion regulating molecule 1 [Borealophlyctis nickersoniae]|nr:adhesion regulating molecule 1 [Borealophlyctis nickersoniae]
MSAVPLFATGAQRKTSLVEIKAGKCTREGSMVKPEAKKGLLYLTQSEDSLMHLCWKDRKTNAVEDDLIIFPEEAELLRVTQSAGRVYVLKFKTSSQRLFFWVQEPKADKDEETIKKFNNLINNPPGSGGGDDELSTNEIMQLLQQSRGGGGPSSSPTTPGPPSAQLEQLQNILRNINVSGTTPSSGQSDISSALTPETVGPLLNNPNISAALFPEIPVRSDRTPEEIRAIIQTPEFTQTAQRLVSGLNSGQLGPLQSAIGSNEDLAAVQAFLQALQDNISRRNDDGDAMDED